MVLLPTGTLPPPIVSQFSLGERPRLQHTTLAGKGPTDQPLEVLRLDEVHPHIHGNKWFKLRPNLEEAARVGQSTLLSFGGAYSNHLYALAAAGRRFGFRTIGLVRGELHRESNPVMRFAADQGMELVALSRSDYRRKADPDFIDGLVSSFGEHYLIPEGGANLLGVKGCAAMAELLQGEGVDERDLIALAVGTGTTLAGLVSGLSTAMAEHSPEVLGINVVAAEAGIGHDVRQWLDELQRCAGVTGMPLRYRLRGDFHHGGYAKTSQALMQFIEAFNGRTGIPLEPVYTGKLMYALEALAVTGDLSRYRRVIAIHSGGVTEGNLNSLYKTMT